MMCLKRNMSPYPSGALCKWQNTTQHTLLQGSKQKPCAHGLLRDDLLSPVRTPYK